jgi:signal transduction histidine kinase
MPGEVIRSIFNPFFTTKPNGTGLGLSIVHSILDSYESRLDVESELNRGTTVTMKLKQIDPPT